MKKQLIVCPNCEVDGKKEVLGEIKDNTFKVLRFHKGETIFVSNDFSVYCGKCGELVYYYKNDKNSTNNRK